jgi:hypothetical protein
MCKWRMHMLMQTPHRCTRWCMSCVGCTSLHRYTLTDAALLSHLYLIQDHGVGASCSDGVEVVLDSVNGLLHAGFLGASTKVQLRSSYRGQLHIHVLGHACRADSERQKREWHFGIMGDLQRIEGKATDCSCKDFVLHLPLPALPSCPGLHQHHWTLAPLPGPWQGHHHHHLPSSPSWQILHICLAALACFRVDT